MRKSYSEAGLKLPGKKIFGNNFDPAFIKSRKEGLNEFMTRLIKVSGHLAGLSK